MCSSTAASCCSALLNTRGGECAQWLLTQTSSLPVNHAELMDHLHVASYRKAACWRRIWGFWVSPLQYSQNAISINEFTAPRWQTPYSGNPSVTLGHEILSNRGLFTCASPLEALTTPHQLSRPAVSSSTTIFVWHIRVRTRPQARMAAGHVMFAARTWPAAHASEHVPGMRAQVALVGVHQLGGPDRLHHLVQPHCYLPARCPQPCVSCSV